jgi:hypothetical protein
MVKHDSAPLCDESDRRREQAAPLNPQSTREPGFSWLVDPPRQARIEIVEENKRLIKKRPIKVCYHEM